MITVKVDKSRWEARYKRVLSRRAFARRQIVIESARLVARRAFVTAPTDTHRFQKNLAQAANDAGVGPLPVPATNRSKFADRYLPILQSELNYWDMRRQQYEREGRTEQRYYQKIMKKLAKAQLELTRFEQTEDAVVFNAFGGKRAPSVRYKNYTGRGWIKQTRNQTIVTLHNTEAHASIVEARHRTMRNAISAVRAGGGAITRLSKKRYL